MKSESEEIKKGDKVRYAGGWVEIQDEFGNVHLHKLPEGKVGKVLRTISDYKNGKTYVCIEVDLEIRNFAYVSVEEVVKENSDG